MFMGKLSAVASLLFACSFVALTVAADAPATQPSETKPRAGRLVQPWSLLKTLTPEQVTKIEKIHADASEEVKKIHAKETDDITALLTPAQVAELKADEAKKKAETAIHHKEAATQP